jgi:hypothetical protein
MDQTSMALRRLGTALREQAAEIAKATAIRVRQELPEYYQVENPDFQASAYAAVSDVITCAWTVLDDGGRCPDHLPSNLVGEAVNAARNNFSWEVVDRSYHITHELIWDALVTELASCRLSRTEHTLVLKMASKCMFRCFDFLTTSAGHLYQAERADWLDRRQKRLVELVTDALDGLAISDAELGYGTYQYHLAVIGWGRDPQSAISRAARIVKAEQLVVPSVGSCIWAWLGRARFDPYDKLVRAFVPDSKTYLAIGSLEFGRKGFAASHQQAQLASSILTRQLLPTPRNVITYPEVAIETLILADEMRARIFADHVLGPLGAGDPKSIKLRETLRAYCQSDQNTVLAARALGIAERTVRHRLRAAEDLLGGFMGLQKLALAVRAFDALEAHNARRLAVLDPTDWEAANAGQPDSASAEQSKSRSPSQRAPAGSRPARRRARTLAPALDGRSVGASG